MRTAFLITAILIFQGMAGAQGITPSPDLKKLVEQSFSNYPKVGEMTDLVKMGEVRVRLGKAGYIPVAGANLSYRNLYPVPVIPLPGNGGQTQEIRIQPADNYNASI